MWSHVPLLRQLSPVIRTERHFISGQTISCTEMGFCRSTAFSSLIRFSAQLVCCIMTLSDTRMHVQEAELAAEKLHDALIINSVRCKLLWGKPQAQAQNSMAPSGGAVAGSEAAGPSEPYGQPLIAPDGALMPPPRFFGQQANYPSMDPSQMGSAPKGPEGGPAGAGGPSMAPGMRPPGGPPMPHMMQGGMNMPPPGMIPQQWQFMHPAGPMGARPPMGGMHAMRPPQPGMIPPMSMGGMAPHPAAQSGFGMTAPVKMGAAPKPRGPAPAPKPAAPPVSAPSAAAATEVQPQGAPAPDPVPAVESSAS